MFLPLCAFATDEVGAPAKVWTDPVIYTFDQPVTWYFDMSGTGFVDGQDMYLWAWSPSEPDAGHFDKSSDFAKLEYVGNMVWKKTLTPISYFNVSVADIMGSAGFWMRLKGLGNTVQSAVIQVPWSVTDINTFKDSGKAVQIFPEKFYLNEPLSILVNIDKVWTGAVQGGLVGSESIYMHSGLNNFAAGAIVEANMGVPELVQKTKLKDIGNHIYKIDLTPSVYYGVPDDYVMENIEFLFPSKDWVKVGTDAGGKNFVVLAPGVPIPPDPELYIFPKKFSQLDIVTIIRKFNEKFSTGLTFTITAGSKTITGDFTGTKDERRTYINLLNELGTQPALDKIKLVIKHKNGAEILNTDIPLVPLSELE